jgi:solute carrier family 25 S-adenosylmethionine transporter 26
VIRSSSLRRIDADPLVSIVSRVVSKSIARRTATTSTASTTQQPLTIPQRLVSGGCSRGIAQALLYPVDALRTLAQTRDGRTLADVGLSALGKGCLTTSSFAVGIGAIQFAIFGATRNSCGPLISAALGAAGSCLVSVPQEVIKQRLVTGVYPSFRSAVATIYSADGVSGFYSGWRPTVARNIPFVVATFLSMDYLTRLRLNHKERTNENAKASLTVAENLAIGVSGALIAGTLTHPGKTRTS